MSSLVPASLHPTMSTILSVLPSTIPGPIKYAFWLLLAVNIQHFPGVWHLRIIWPFIRFQWEVKLGRVWKNWRIGVEDVQKFTLSRSFRATPDSCDSFGLHLSNSEYAVTVDHVRGPFVVQLIGETYMIPGATFALGATSFEYKKEIPIMGKFTVENSLLGYDKKWLYVQTRFHSLPHPKTGAVTTYALVLSHVVMKHNRRTISPHRAIALAGYGAQHGKQNWEIVQKLSAKEKLQWLVEEGEGAKKGQGIVVGEVELGMDKKGEWPGQLKRD
ncbi:uncharacterized protein JCM15063_004762 [Sporobolomyces koalae]|uniref:uncharacterized protein n=1 Tax=Sporobolomyces koalae TaxID=500713 RepID=UPI00317A742D